MNRAWVLGFTLLIALAVGPALAVPVCDGAEAADAGLWEPTFPSDGSQSSGVLTSSLSLGRAVRIPVCGDGVCLADEPPFGENCSTCPEDCGGPCGGSDCPKVISSRTVTVLVGMQWQGNLACFAGIYYQPALMTYRRYIEDTIHQCDGSIITQIRPGSTTTFTSCCYRRTSFFCFGGNPFPPPCQL